MDTSPKISCDIHEYPNEISTQDILWISNALSFPYPEKSRDIQITHPIQIPDILMISKSISSPSLISKKISFHIQGYPHAMDPWIFKRWAASKSRAPQWQPQLLGDGWQISPDWLNPKELQPLRPTCPGAADGAWPTSACQRGNLMAPIFKLNQYYY
jgi:hypothetical protein